MTSKSQMPPLSGLTTIELFCGIGGFRLAADRLGLKTLFANDLNALSCDVYRDNFGHGEIHEGDIHDIIDTIPSHDLLTGGFPCQPFSAAGKKEGIRDPRGTLFQTIVDVIANAQPEYFILENVKRLLTMEQGRHFATILSALSELNYWIEWRLLNARDFGLAQNRERVLICGRRSPFPHQTNDCLSAIRLADPQEFSEVRSGHRHMVSRYDSWKQIESHGIKFPSWGMAYLGRFVSLDLDNLPTAAPTVLLTDVLETSPPPEYDLTEKTLPRLSSNTPVNRFVQGVEVVSNQGGGARMGYTIFGINGLAPTLTASTSRHYERYKIGESYRRLTPIEYARLQGFPETHCRAASAYDQYSLLGNAVPPPLVEWVMRRWLTDEAAWTATNNLNELQRELFHA